MPFERSSRGGFPYLAVIPAEHVRTPSLAYTIEIERTDGQRLSAFASRDEMQPVDVVPDFDDAREVALLARLEGRRSVVSASGEYVTFGDADAKVQGATPGAPLLTKRFRDGYYRVEGQYTYRFLRTVAEFGIRAGVVRGRSVVADERDAGKFDVGLNYGAPHLRLRATDWLHFEGEFLTSVTEVGFSIGGGASVLLGDPYGSKLTLGAESIEVFGSRAYSRLDIAASRRLTVSPIIEVTDMPHAATAGVRLLTDLRFDFGGGFAASLRGGYQARNFATGGPALATSISYAF